ncbi:MAG: hypothetical protein ACRC5M_07320 [Anaeroplasmataceae bacterium]
MENKNIYSMTSKDDNTLKQFFENYHCLPKNKKYTEYEKAMIEKYELIPSHEDVIKGENGYIVFRYNKKKFTEEEVNLIKKDTGSTRQKAKKYKVSPATINKINNDKY